MRRILLVEPDVQLAATYIAALSAGGYTVDHCSGAQAAVTAADAAKPDLIVLELQLAGSNGLEFLYEFRSYADWQIIPLLLLTNVPAVEFAHDRETLARHLGIRTYLYKPHTTLSQLLRAVREILPPGDAA